MARWIALTVVPGSLGGVDRELLPEREAVVIRCGRQLRNVDEPPVPLADA
jgi:hypothetical protein